VNRALLLLRNSDCKETSLWWLKAAYNWTHSCWSLSYFCHQNKRYKLNGLFFRFWREAVGCIIKFFLLSPRLESALQHHVQTPCLLFDVMRDRENALEVQRVFMSTCYLYDHNWIWGWKASEICLQFEFLEIRCCKMQFYIKRVSLCLHPMKSPWAIECVCPENNIWPFWRLCLSLRAQLNTR